MSDDRSFSPLKSTFLLKQDALVELSPDEVSFDNVGQKAFGLSCLPDDWVPPFCVISHDAAKLTLSSSHILELLKSIPWIKNGPLDSLLMVRSSAIHETIGERGQLVSEQTTFRQLQTTLANCLKATESSGQVIHWILQPKIEQKSMGHLSNERRVAKVKRDWLLEFEVTASDAENRSPVPIGIRNWREGDFVGPAVLACGTAIGIDGVLREPAKWATDQKLRIHYEWIWDGSRVWIVQADFCGPVVGIPPESVLPKKIQNIEIAKLKYFRLATGPDFQNYRKLANTQLYSELGYTPPPFYILDDRSVIDSLMAGTPSAAVVNDIETLISQRTLVIRTDGITKQMLPRTDGLSSSEAVLGWFKDELPEKLKTVEGWQGKLVFICHHFLPAVASAWSRAEPDKRVVRVEALWGIPEGMYWYSHDAYEVDTAEVDLGKAIANTDKFKFAERLRYKEWFVAPDDKGVWVNHKASEPYDWKSTITNNEWLSDIAVLTRQIASQLGHSVNVMWFLGVHKDTSQHQILPWFHEKSELNTNTLRVAPRFKDPNSKGIEIHTLSEWTKVIHLPENEKSAIKRISVSPREPNLIRNDGFLKELATFAIKNGAAVELMGGILSHVFYILQREGCIVEIVDPFGTNEESLVFKKLVRDKVPESIEQKGEVVTHLKISGDQLIKALKSKLLEEALEVMDTQSTSDTQEELADVLEVIHAISKHLNISMKSIEETRKQKKLKRGGFDQGIVLVKTSVPPSLSTESFTQEQILSLFADGVVFEAGSVVLEPDIKLHQDEPESQGIKQRLLEIEFPVSQDMQIKRSTEFKIQARLEKEVVEIPLQGEWVINRKKSDLKVRLLITPAPVQIKLPF